MKLILSLAFLLGLCSCASTKTVDTNKLPMKIAQKKWETNSFEVPESTYFEKNLNLVFVSNINGKPLEKNGAGYISLVSTSGKMVAKKWVTGLNAPKGMISHNNILYVSDIDRVVGINISNGQIVKKIEIQGSLFLNDLAVDSSGLIYVSDLFTGKIHRINGSSHEVFVEGDHLDFPNGLLYHDGKLYVAAWGSNIDRKTFSTTAPGRFYSIDLKDKDIDNITYRLGALDGLERTKDGNFIVSDWKLGTVYHITGKGEVTIIYKGTAGSADIGYISTKNLITIPKMNDNKVEAIKL